MPIANADFQGPCHVRLDNVKLFNRNQELQAYHGQLPFYHLF